MRKLLFIGNSFHKKTRSYDFVVDLLGTDFVIDFCFFDLFIENPYIELSKFSGVEYEVLVCWQVMPPLKELRRNVAFRHGVFFPMFDGCPSIKKPEKWYSFRGFQIISFSKMLDDNLKKIGLSSHYIQYFPEVLAFSDFGKEDSLFFWNRRKKINVNTVAILIRESSIKNVHIHKVLDPGNDFIKPDNPREFLYSFSSWYETRKEMLAEIESSAFYIAPREKEGIGMSFLEAMAMGRCVIAPDQVTMNEYIEHGRTGYLYDLKNPKPLEIDDVREIQKNVLEFMKDGYEKWNVEKENIFKWCEAPLKKSNVKFLKALVIRFFRNPIKVIKVLWNEK